MQKNTPPDLLREVAAYYTEKLAQHGQTPHGVDWNGKESQLLRLDQLCKLVTLSKEGSFSVNDVGCGYGALFGFLADNYNIFSYCGIDISQEMIQAARQLWQDQAHARFLVSAEPDASADYGMASGIFNVRLERSDAEWLDYIKTTLDMLDRTSRLGFAFNCLTSYSDEEKKRAYLYYADPCLLFDWCKCRYSKQVALLHDYGLYEFTILVRKIL